MILPAPLPDATTLALFAAIEQCGSLTAAARSVGLSQPAATQRVAKLERQAGTDLLDRTRRPAQLTPAGLRLSRAAAPFLSATQELSETLAALAPRGAAEVLRIGMPDSLAEIAGAEILGALSGQARRIELRSGISPWLEQAFAAAEFDLAIDSPPYARGPGGPNLLADPLVLVAPEKRRGMRLADIVALPHVAYGRNSKLGRLCETTARELGAAGQARFGLDSTQSLLRFVQAGYGWAVTTAVCLLQSPEAAAGLVVHPLQQPPRRFELLLSSRLEDRGEELGARLAGLMAQMTRGPWARRLPNAAALLARANGWAGSDARD